MKTARDLEKKELYKFRAFPHDPNKLHYVERIFSHNELYFPSPDQLNDPFEFRPNMVLGDLSDPDYRKKFADRYRLLFSNGIQNPTVKPEDIENWLQNCSQDEAKNLVELDIERLYRLNIRKYRVCSFCASATNPLTWSHYSDLHKGFCLVFDTNNDIFGGAIPVDYKNEYPTLDVTESDEEVIFRKSALTKFTGWSYEEEYRLISMEPNEPGALPVKDKKFIFPAEMLVAVIFGCRTSEDDSELIEGWLKNRGKNIELRQARLSDTEYDLKIGYLSSLRI